MIILANIRWYFVMLGTFPISTEKLKLYNLQNFRMTINRIHVGLYTVCLMLYVLSVMFFVKIKAKTFAQYAEGFFFCMITFTRLAMYCLINSRKSLLTSMLNDLQSVIHASMLFVHFPFSHVS